MAAILSRGDELKTRYVILIILVSIIMIKHAILLEPWLKYHKDIIIDPEH